MSTMFYQHPPLPTRFEHRHMRHTLTTLLIAGALSLGCTPPVAPQPPNEPPPTPPSEPPEPEASLAESAESAESAEPNSHEYWGATVVLGATPPWAELPPADAELVKLGTLRTIERTLPFAVRDSWKAGRSIAINDAKLKGAQFSPNKQQVAVLGLERGQLYFYNAKNGLKEKEVALPSLEQASDALSFSYATEVEGPARLFLASPQGAQVLYPESGEYSSLGRASSGSEVSHTKRHGLYGVDNLALGGDKIFLQWVTAPVAASITCKKSARDWSLSEDGKILALLYAEERLVELLDIERRRILAEVPAPEEAASLAVSPSGKLLALGGKSLVLFSLEQGKVVATDDAFSAGITRVRFTPQEDLLLVSTKQGTINSYALPASWETADKLSSPQTLKHERDAVIENVQLSWDGRDLVTTGSDKKIRLWSR